MKYPFFWPFFATVTSSLQFQTLYYNQSLDHFNPQTHARWPHRYLFNDQFWDGRGVLANGCPGPILLYTGNEGDITDFWESNGFMTDYLAPKWGALLLFPEERYYGESLPFGESSFSTENLRYLTTEQVLEDYVDIVEHIKASLVGAEYCPVVSFGGSYGGTLTTFLRASYPATVIGGLASSAPVGYYDQTGWEAHGVDMYTFSDIVTRVYDDADVDCVKAIHSATEAIDATEASDAVEAFHVCEASGLGQSAQSDLFLYALEGLPQQDYPYPVGTLPAWPVKYVCEVLVEAFHADSAAVPLLIDAAVNVTQLALGYNSTGPCLETMLGGPGNIPGDGPGPGNWGYQSCTQTLHAFSSRGIRDYTFNWNNSAEYPCAMAFDSAVVPDPSALTRRFGGYALGDGLTGITNLIWSNGGLDPWGGGGFHASDSDIIEDGNHRIFIPNGAHHLDLRAPHPNDPYDVTEARVKEERIIRGWIEDYAIKRAVVRGIGEQHSSKAHIS